MQAIPIGVVGWARMHAGSLEALRVARPEAAGLATKPTKSHPGVWQRFATGVPTLRKTPRSRRSRASHSANRVAPDPMHGSYFQDGRPTGRPGGSIPRLGVKLGGVNVEDPR